MANYWAARLGSPLCNRAPTALQPMAHKPHWKRQLRRDRSDIVADASKTVWVQTVNKSALTAAVESGFDTMVFEDRALIEEWEKLAKFQAVVLDGEDIWDRDGGQLGMVCKIRDGADMKKLMSQELPEGIVVMDASDWQGCPMALEKAGSSGSVQIIPAENLVAAAQQQERPVQLLAVASTATEARAMMEALEVGTGGVVLRTDDPAQVRELAVWMAAQQVGEGCALELESARVVTVDPVGMGDRACVDLCSLCRPGEGLLVGSFARALFLVHSECADSSYINSRPFRVNAGPVHSYLQAPGDRTAYLSELQCGSEVLIVDAHGRQRTAIVGRVKIERRPLVLVTAETQDGQQHSSLLQNAETVKLVGPSSSASGWQAVPVTQMEPGQELLLRRQAAARHTGMSIEESIIER